jgi:hypothetical protein
MTLFIPTDNLRLRKRRNAFNAEPFSTLDANPITVSVGFESLTPARAETVDLMSGLFSCRVHCQFPFLPMLCSQNPYRL